MQNSLPLCVVVLAAGKGTRMKSARAKVLHEVFYRPMLHHVLDSVAPLEPLRTVVIVGHQQEAVKAILSGYDVVCCEQKEQNGTGHAVLCAQPLLADFRGTIMILCGDSPLLEPAHLEQMIASHRRSGARLTIMTTVLRDPTNYGRIISDADGAVKAVVEEKDASAEQRAITEINAGIYIGEAAYLFSALSRVTTDNAQQEMYLTDIVSIAVEDGLRVNKFEHPHPSHVLGVNSKVELAQAHAEIRARRNNELMANGVTMLDPQTTTVGSNIAVGSGCTFAAQVTVIGSGSIGDNCRIEPGAYLCNSVIENDVHIGANCVITDRRVAAGTVIAPLTLLAGTAAEDI
ncbi:MAG: NTP transferase domain-containing protein [Desulfofustis sp.]